MAAKKKAAPIDWTKKYAECTRFVGKKERYANKCKCGCFMPDEYSMCDGCFIGQFDLEETHDALDFLGFTPLVKRDDVLRLLRIMIDGVYVTIDTKKKRYRIR